MIAFRNIVLIILIIIFYMFLSIIYSEISGKNFPTLLSLFFAITLGLYVKLKDKFEQGNN